MILSERHIVCASDKSMTRVGEQMYDPVSMPRWGGSGVGATVENRGGSARERIRRGPGMSASATARTSGIFTFYQKITIIITKSEVEVKRESEPGKCGTRIVPICGWGQNKSSGATVVVQKYDRFSLFMRVLNRLYIDNDNFKFISNQLGSSYRGCKESFPIRPSYC
jgi:hypothetical protein